MELTVVAIFLENPCRRHNRENSLNCERSPLQGDEGTALVDIEF